MRRAITLGWLLAAVLATAGVRSADGQSGSAAGEPPRPMMLQVNVKATAFIAHRCTHTETEKCAGCQDNNTITLVATGAVKQNDPRAPLFSLISMKAHVRYDRRWTCPFDGEVDAEFGEKDVPVFSPMGVSTQAEPIGPENGFVLLSQTPVTGDDLARMGLPAPSWLRPPSPDGIFKWNLHLFVPYKTVRRRWPDRQMDQWLTVRTYTEVAKKGPSIGEQGFTFQANPEEKVSLLAWNLKAGRGGVSEIAPESGDPASNAKWSVTVGWKIGGGDRRVKITYPEQDQNYIFGSSESGKLEMLPEATTGNPIDDPTIEPWSIDAISGSELKIVTLPGDSTPARGPNVRVTFEPMPTRNDAFGRKTLRSEDASVTVKVFFDKDKRDNPDGDVPNWFYYWKQGAVPNLQECHYSKSRKYYGFYRHAEDKVYICDLAGEPEPAYEIQLYQTLQGPWGPRTEGPEYYLDRKMIKPTSVLKFPRKTSIETCHCTVLHEMRHQELFKMCQGHSPDYDLDGDGAPDWVEQASEWGLDSLIPDTHFLKDQIDRVYEFNGDNELLARVRELEFSPDKTQDWAWPGSQSDPPEK